MSAKTCGHSVYLAGCETCRAERRLYNKKHLRTVSRTGPQTLPGEPLRKVIDYADKAGISRRAVADRMGATEHNLSRIARGTNPTVYRRTHDSLLRALRQELDIRVQVLADLSAALDFAQGVQDRKRLDTGPLRAALNGRAKTVLGVNGRAKLSKPTISEKAALEVCHLAGLDFEDVYQDAC